MPPVNHPVTEHAESWPQAPNQVRRALIALVAMVAGLVVVASSLFLVYQREAAIEDATLRVTDSARLLEEHVKRTLRASDFIVGRVVDLGRSMPMEKLVGDEPVWRELVSLLQGLPEPGTLWIVNADGVVVQGTLKFPAFPSNVGDRRYFSLHKESRRDLVIGPLVWTKQREKQAFHLSRRIETPEGRFLGVAVAGFDADTFTDFYRTLPLGTDGAVTVVDLDGSIILRQPKPELWAGLSLAGDGPLMSALRRGVGGGTLVGVSPLDKVERLSAFRLIPEFGLVVAVGVSMDEVLADWRRQTVVTLLVGVALSTILGGLVALAFSGLKREEALITGLENSVRERTEEARLQAEEAKRANESKTRFLAAASHDLRQPLQAAGMFVEVLGSRLDGTNHLAIVDKLRQSVEATQSLLTALLDVSTLEAGKVRPQPVAFDLDSLLHRLYSQMEPEAAASGLRLRMVHTSAAVVSDPILLERMVRNLLVNALRYTAHGGVVLGCRRRGDGRLGICVADSGAGIPPEMHKVIFDDFTRLDDNEPKGRNQGRGLGLGLGVVRRMAGLLGHSVTIRSQPGKGSCFTVIVPLALDDGPTP